MPLSEISTNSVERRRKAPDSPATSIINAYADNRSDVSAPSSIQSMLKNTTETGDIGIFSISPTGVLYPHSRVSCRTSSLPYISDGLPPHQLNQLIDNGHQGHHRALNSRQNSLRSHHGTITSSIISMYQTESQKSFHLRTSHAQHDDHRALSMSQSSQFSYNMSNYHPYGALRPRSPYAYPTRLKRPGYRPSSPALMDFNGTDARTPFGLDKGANFRTPSPLSAPPYRRGPAAYPSNINRSMPSLQRCTSPLARARSRSSIAPPLPSRSTAPRLSSDQSVWPSNHGFQREISHGRIWPRQPSPSPAMRYYDYSEDFEEQQNQHCSNIPVSLLAEQVIAEVKAQSVQAQEVALKLDTVNKEPVPAVILDPDETAEQTRTKSVPVLESPSPITAPGKFLQQMSEWETEQIYLSASPQDKRKHGKEKENYRAVTPDNEDKEQDIVELPSINNTYGHHILSSSKPEARDRFVKDPRRSTPDAAVQPVGVLSNAFQGHYNFQALKCIASRSNSPEAILSTVPRTAVDRSLLVPWHIPSLDFGQPRFDTSSQDISNSSHEKLKYSSLMSQMSTPTIRAPIPERSVSSPTNKDRFSRILSIDGSFDDLDRAVADSEEGIDLSRTASTNELSRNDRPVLPRDSISSVEFTETTIRANVCIDAVDVQEHIFIPNRSKEEYTRTDSNTSQYYGNSRASTERLRSSKIGIGNSVNYPRLTAAKGLPKIPQSNQQARQQSQESSDLLEEFSQSINIEASSQGSAVGEPVHEPSVMPLLEAASIVPWEYDEPKKSESFPGGRYRLKSKADQKLERKPMSAPDLRSGDPQTSHSRDGPSDNSEPSMVRSSRDSSNPTRKSPRFKFKITRASSSTNDTVRITRQTSVTSSPRPSFAIGADFFHAGPFGRKSKSEDHPDCSHDPDFTAGYRPFPAHAHFKEQLDRSALSANQSGLRPPSPNVNFTEVQSFFSDDSSTMEPRGSFRERISQFKAITSRGNSTDDFRALERRQGNKGDSRPQSRHSSVRDDGATKGMSTIKYKAWKLGEKFRFWWHRGEEKLKGLGGKVKKRNRRKRSVSTELYPGV